MKRRLILLVLAAAALIGATSPAAAVLPDQSTAGGYWACVGTRHIDFGACVQNPLPDQLPMPTAG